MGCSESMASNQVNQPGADMGKRQGATSGSTEGLCHWLPDAEKASSSSVAENITIIHFNDVYNVEERQKEPVGGAARFKAQIDSLRHLEPLILFSGDALNPSNSQSVVFSVSVCIPVLASSQLVLCTCIVLLACFVATVADNSSFNWI